MTRSLHPTLHRFQLLPWRYRTEGNQKALFSCPPHALLVYKTPPLPQPPAFQCLQPYLLHPHVVTLSPHHVALLEQQRTGQRRGALTTYAEVVPDLALLWGTDTILVEVKPKAMTLCRSKLVPVEVCDALRKFEVPSYHVRNYLGRVVEKRYIPAELLGEGKREQLGVLWKEGSNALRILRGGEEGEIEEQVLDVAATVLEREAVLHRVREVQGRDYLDCIGAELLLNKAKGQGWEVGDVLEEWRQRVSYESAEEGRERHCKLVYEQAVREVQSMPEQVAAGLVAQFMAARAAMDCSVMIAMTRGGRQMEIDVGDGGVGEVGEWTYCVRVIDVGGKPVERIKEKWVPREWEYVKRVRDGEEL